MKTIETINGVEIIVQQDEKYFQVNDATGEELKAIWQHIKDKYKGFENAFCFRNVEIPIKELEVMGAKILDDATEIRLFREDFDKLKKTEGKGSIANSTKITPITLDNYDFFAKHHDATFPEGFWWTSERIRKEIDNWGVFACFDGEEITDYVVIKRSAAEIFCIPSNDVVKAKALLVAAALLAFGDGNDNMLYMIDESEVSCMEAAMELGFKKCGFYKGYTVDI